MEWQKGLIESLALTTFFQIPDEPVKGHFWYDAAGKETDNLEKVVRKEPAEVQRRRMAKTADEFRLVYDREFARTGLKSGTDNHALFINILKKHTRGLIEKHVANRDYATTDFEVLSVAESFLNYLDPYMIANPRPMTDLAKEMNLKKVDKLPYDIRQCRFFSFDNAAQIKYQFNEGEDPDIFHQYVFTQENLQLIIRFEKEFAISSETEVTGLLDKQYQRCVVMGTPQDLWLDNVEKIIAHRELLKRPDYAKNDAVKLWFRSRREELTKAAPEVPFIGGLFYRNLNINEVVTDAYYGLVRQPRGRDEISRSYVGPLHHYNPPYQVSYYGAYINMGTLELLDMYRKDKMQPYDQITEKQIDQGLKDYAEGFKKGYHEFDKEVLDKNPFQDPAHKASIIFDFITGRFQSISTLPLTMGRPDGNLLAGWKDAGLEGGQLYRAWYLILENHALFGPMFKARRQQHAKKPGKSTLTLDEVAILRVFNNEPVSRENHNAVAVQYGHTSGQKLYLLYNWYTSTANRRATADTLKKLLHKIKRFEAAAAHVMKENQPKILAEIEGLKQLMKAFG